MTKRTTNRFSPEVRERTVRPVLDHEGIIRPDGPPASRSPRRSVARLTLLDRVKRAETDAGKRAGLPTEMAERMKAVERENRELRQANETLRKASAYFAQAPLAE